MIIAGGVLTPRLFNMKWKNSITGELYLDDRDKAILKALVEKRDQKELAYQLCMSHRTIEVRIRKMKDFLNVRSCSELVLIAYLLGVLEYEKPQYIKHILARKVIANGAEY